MITIRPEPEPFAVVGLNDSVPLTRLEDLVGTELERLGTSHTMTAASTATAAFLINYRVPRWASDIRIRITRGMTELVNGRFEALNWHKLVAAAVDDNLDHTSTPTTDRTGLAMEAVFDDDFMDVGGDAPNVVVGRTAGELLLIEYALQVGDVVEVYFTDFNGGALAERLGRQSTLTPQQFILRKRSSTPLTSSDAPNALVYDGSSLSGLDGWSEDELAGSDPEYLLFTNFLYNPLAGRWIQGQVTIVAGSDGLFAQYGVDDTGPWHVGKLATDNYVRFRDINFGWHVVPLNRRQDGWRLLFAKTYSNNSNTAATQYWEEDGWDLDEWKWLLFTWTLLNGKAIPIAVPTVAMDVTTYFNSWTDIEGAQRILRFRKSVTGPPYFSIASANTTGGNGNHIIFRLQLEILLGNDPARWFNIVRIAPIATGLSGTFRAYIGK